MEMTMAEGRPLQGEVGEHFRHHYIFQQGPVTLLVMLFNGRHHAELCRQLREPFLLGGPGKSLIHIRPLKVLALCSRSQIGSRVPNAASDFVCPVCKHPASDFEKVVL